MEEPAPTGSSATPPNRSPQRPTEITTHESTTVDPGSVQADLATFSKAMANGFAISAVTGRRDIMLGLAQTKISSTFFASPVEMAAALATIDILESTDAIDRIWQSGARLLEGLVEIVRDTGLPAEPVGYSPMPFLRFDVAHPRVKAEFFARTTAGGVLLHPDHQWFLSAAHTTHDVDTALRVCREAARAVVRNIGSRTGAGAG